MIFLINLLFAAELDARSLDGIDPVLVNELMTLQPVTTRAGYPRFVDGALDHDQASQVLAVRLHAAEDEVPVRAALAAHLAYSADVDLLLDLLEAEQDPDVALHLLPGLKDAPADVALPALRDALRHDAPGMRAEAARVLSLRKDGGDASAALIAALDDEAPEVRAFAARALGTTTSPRPSCRSRRCSPTRTTRFVSRPSALSGASTPSGLPPSWLP